MVGEIHGRHRHHPMIHYIKRRKSKRLHFLVDDPSEYGIALLNERQNHQVPGKPVGVVFSNTANTGVYVFEPVLELIPRGVAYGFEISPLAVNTDQILRVSDIQLLEGC